MGTYILKNNSEILFLTPNKNKVIGVHLDSVNDLIEDSINVKQYQMTNSGNNNFPNLIDTTYEFYLSNVEWDLRIPSARIYLEKFLQGKKEFLEHEYALYNKIFSNAVKSSDLKFSVSYDNSERSRHTLFSLLDLCRNLNPFFKYDYEIIGETDADLVLFYKEDKKSFFSIKSEWHLLGSVRLSEIRSIETDNGTRFYICTGNKSLSINFRF